MPDSELQVCCRPASIRLTPAQESTLVEDAVTLLQKVRREMGYDASPGAFRRESWLWQRSIATRSFAKDYSWRLEDPRSILWKSSNRTLDLVSKTITEHRSKLVKDFDGSSFLALHPDGPEDQSFILKPAEQYLAKRAETLCLGTRIKNDGIRAALIRGESVFKALHSFHARTVEVEAPILMQSTLDGQGLEPARDSQGGYITQEDAWVPLPSDPAVHYLERDPATRRPAQAQPRYSDRKFKVRRVMSSPAGSDISFPFWADFVCPLDAPNLDAAKIKGHVFELAVDDVFDMLPRHLITPAGEKYYKDSRHQGGPLPPAMGGLQAELSNPRWFLGEEVQNRRASQEQANEADLPTRLYAEIWLRYRLDPASPQRSDIGLLVDVESMTPIWYNHAHEILRDDRRHPFGVLRVNPEEGRWYGSGYFEQFGDIAQEADADINRIAVDNQKSGNIIAENRQATEEGMQGIPLSIRSPRTLKLRDQKSLDDAVQVKTIPPASAELRNSVEFWITGYQARTGGVSPGDTEGQQLAANTATGLQILQEVENVQVADRRADLSDRVRPRDGIPGLLATFAEIELTQISETLVRQMFGAATIKTGQLIPLEVPSAADPSVMEPVNQPQVDPATGLPVVDAAGQPVLEPVMVEETVPIADTLLAWARSLRPQDVHNLVRLVTTRSRSSQILQNDENILKILERWTGLQPTLQNALKPVFVRMLMALDESDPVQLLDQLQQAASDPAVQASLFQGSRPAPGPLGAQEATSPARRPGAPTTTGAPVSAANPPVRPGPPGAPASAARPVITGRPDPAGPGGSATRL